MANVPVKRRNEDFPTTSESAQPRLDPYRLMQDMLSWDPFREMSQLRLGGGAQGFTPFFEVQETPEAYVFWADVPGVRQEDLDITLNQNRLTVSGKREPEAPPRDQDRFFVYERGYGSFSRAFTLPAGIDPDRLGAELKDGVLKLILPKRPEMQPRRITIGQKPPGERGQA